jgi:hypothetical protein
MKNITLTLVLIASLIFCKKDESNSEDVADYFIPLQNGKYITYRLDSTVFLENGRSEAIHSYQERHEVRESFKDNQGRTSYWIDRFIRDVNGIKAWKLARCIM